jgi:hypothetical protein
VFGSPLLDARLAAQLILVINRHLEGSSSNSLAGASPRLSSVAAALGQQ